MNHFSADWEQQRVFLAVLREGSLSAAARALQVAQPTVRRRLEALESALGSALFTRSPMGLHPTEAARDLSVHAETMAAAAEAFARAASAGRRELAGHVRISASEVTAAEVLPGMLAPLQRMHPRLVFELSATNRTEDLLRHEVDIAIRMLQPTQGTVVARHVGQVALGFFAHRDYLARAGMPVTLDDMPRFTLIGPDRDTSVLRSMSALAPTLRRSAFNCRTDSQLAQLGAIRAGWGIGVCQAPLAGRDPSLVAVLPGTFSHPLETWVTMHEDQRRVRRVDVVFKHLVQSMTAYCSTVQASDSTGPTQASP